MCARQGRAALGSVTTRSLSQQSSSNESIIIRAQLGHFPGISKRLGDFASGCKCQLLIN